MINCELFGIPAQRSPVEFYGNGRIKRQTITMSRRCPASLGYKPGSVFVVNMCFEDEYKNGHETFAITAHVYKSGDHDWQSCGWLHDETKIVFPELAHLIKWHLVSLWRSRISLCSCKPGRRPTCAQSLTDAAPGIIWSCRTIRKTWCAWFGLLSKTCAMNLNRTDWRTDHADKCDP